MAHPIGPGRRRGWAIAAQMSAVLAVLFGLLLGAGWLVSGPEADTDVEVADGRLTSWFAENRVEELATPSRVVSDLGSTGVVIGAGVVAAAVAGSLLRSWWPVRLLAAALIGELVVFLAVSSIIDRERPPVPHLDAQLPPTSSYPSGHTAASLCLYGGIAAVVYLVSRSRWRRVVVVGAGVVVLAVATSRLYRGAHWPTDVAASVLFASAWLWTCIRALAPADRPVGRGSRRGGRSRASAAGDPSRPHR
ncbi:phosphatase PAP2 family protein [Geodermatophilus sp. YIM 151500]|uniref:phosphatase PAP2 family protein n=1 Tax=Geodermatophilus sp. YIM 151500 TaxID=2984531 RepID=UPI0021E4D1A3|nr:phosphatase PAP2 family protein [Geodermatophilus sp. YIM 151500]MCV2490776.1 phosphatase PAP2 family protein [Geodermatophilus sp. YIM 151500]